ncbi:MAG: ThuA domain-containing protein [Thermomonas sp.]
MKTSRRLAMLLTLLASLAACAVSGVRQRSAGPDAASARILVFTRTSGWRHDSIPVAIDTLRELGAEAGLVVEQTEDPSRFEPDMLSRYRAVVFANTTLDVLDASQQAAFERYIAAGGGFVGIHSAADTEYDWPWYGRLVGAWFDSHPPGLQDSPVRFEAGHALPGADDWQVRDELYNYRSNPRAHVVVIATVDEAAYSGGKMGADHPIAWCHASLGGRAWYTGLGHDIPLYADPRFRAHLLRGLRYATRQSDDC